MTGTLASLATERIEMSPYIFVTLSEVIDANGVRQEVPPYYDLLAFIYPPYRDQSSWYFRVEHRLPSSIVLEPGERVDYEIRIYPLKAGAYHVHSFFLSENFPRLGIGQTIIVTGSGAPTTGEITQLYLPLALGLASFAILMLRVMQISRKTSAHFTREKVARVYFAAKSSFETVWLAGVLFWLASAMPYLPAIEARCAFVLSASAALAAIIVAGYASAIIMPKTRHLAFAMATSAITAAFYFALLFGEGSLYSTYKVPHFFVDGLTLFAVMVANSLLAIYFAIAARNERRKNRLTSVA